MLRLFQEEFNVEKVSGREEQKKKVGERKK